MQYLVPREQLEEMAGFLADLEARHDELGITDVQISLASLEVTAYSLAVLSRDKMDIYGCSHMQEVFLNISKKAEKEAAEELGAARPKQHIMVDAGRLEVLLSVSLLS